MLDARRLLVLVVVALFIGVTVLSLSKCASEQSGTDNDVLFLQSQGDFWFSNDTAYFVKKGVLNPSELEVLKNLAYEKEVVIFSDLRDD